MKTILVLGAGGFLGSYIARAAADRGDLAVRAGYADGRHPLPEGKNLTPVKADVLDMRTLEAALDGVDVVINASAGDRRVTVNGVQAVLNAAAEKGVSRIIQLGTTAVYGLASGTVSEETAPVPITDVDEITWQTEADSLCLQAAAAGRSVIVLRIPHVFGPDSQLWAVTLARRLMEKRWGTLGAFGDGVFNAIDPRDVAAAVLASVDAPGDTAGAFNIRGPETTTWNEFFKRYNKALGQGKLPEMGLTRFGAGYFFGNQVRRFVNLLPVSEKTTELLTPDVPSTQEFDSYRMDATYTIDKAREALSWEPMITLEQSLADAAAWVQAEGLATAAKVPAALGGETAPGGGENGPGFGETAIKGIGALAGSLKGLAENAERKLKETGNAPDQGSASQSGGGSFTERLRAATARQQEMREEVISKMTEEKKRKEKIPLSRRLFPSHLVFKSVPEGGPDVSLAEALDELRGKKADLDAMSEEERRAYLEHREMRASLLKKSLPFVFGKPDAKGTEKD